MRINVISSQCDCEVGLNLNQISVQLIWPKFVLVQRFATELLSADVNLIWTFVKCEPSLSIGQLTQPDAVTVRKNEGSATVMQDYKTCRHNKRFRQLSPAVSCW